jgi:MFS family permease
MLAAQAAILLMVPQFVLLAAAAPVPLIVLSTFVAGIGIEIFGVLWDTALQQHIPHERLSRVSAWDQLGSFVVIPIGLTIAGPLADAIGVAEAILLFGGIFLVAQGSALLSRDVRTLPRLDEPQPEPAIVASKAAT